MRIISGKTALITGGASGIGLGAARALVEKGAAVVVADIDAEGAEKAAVELRAAGGRAMGIVLDVTKEESWTAAREAVADFGPVSILFSNAGVGGGSGPFEDYDPDVWRWNYAVNADAHLFGCRTFLGAMKASGEPSHLVITASMVAVVPPPLSAAYISSKYAALGIAMALRNELAGTNVGISVLMPGMAATRIVETTRVLRPGAVEEGDAAATSRAMQAVLMGGMSPDRIGERVVRAIEQGEYWIFSHPEWKGMTERLTQEMIAAFGESADPSYAGDNLDGVIAANKGRMIGSEV